jgi:fucose permease
MGLGLLAAAMAPSWSVFVAAAVPMGAGGGAIDGGMNGVVLAVTEDGHGRALNLLHLFFSIGALSSPLVAGRIVAASVPWELLLAVSGVVAVMIGIALAVTPMPSGRRSATRKAPPRPGGLTPSPTPAPAGVRLPFVLLAVAIACYVAAEIGVSNWIVAFLDEVPVEVATLGLSGFWAGLALGRLAGAWFGDRYSHSALATAASVVLGVAVVGAVAAPSPELAIGAFALAGFAAGPIFPMIIAVAGELVPGRVSATTGTLTAAAVVGGMVYPPLVGFMSASLGIATGLLGAAGLSIACAAAIVAAARVPRGLPAPLASGP